jgi:hypothetical protein
VTAYEAATQALRARSSAPLTDGLAELLARVDAERVDDRDVMLALAPLHDCARRLGLDPVAVFDAAAAHAPARLAPVVRVFGRRTDITPDAFGFAVVATAKGPMYEPA